MGVQWTQAGGKPTSEPKEAELETPAERASTKGWLAPAVRRT